MSHYIYVVRGRHGELHATYKKETALDLWAESNGYGSWNSFNDDLGDEIEISKNHLFLDEGGQVNYVVVE